jgi:uncharacterized membrane protein SirB2
MGALYPDIKLLHITCVVLSGSLFVLRGLMMTRGSSYANHPTLRRCSYVIDTTLLGAAVILAAVLHQYPFVHAWLTVKAMLLIVYIVLGVFALRRGRTRRSRSAFFVAALLVYGFIVSVAMTYDPLGIFRGS